MTGEEPGVAKIHGVVTLDDGTAWPFTITPGDGGVSLLPNDVVAAVVVDLEETIDRRRTLCRPRPT